MRLRAPRDKADGEREAPREGAFGRERQSRSDCRKREEIGLTRVRGRLAERGPNQTRRLTNDHDGGRVRPRNLEALGGEIGQRDRAARAGVESHEAAEQPVAGQAIQDLQRRTAIARSDQEVRNAAPVESDK